VGTSLSLQVASESRRRENLELWNRAIAQARGHSPASFEQWFSSVQFDGIHSGVLVLTARDEFVRDWVKDHFQPILLDVLRALSTQPVDEVKWHVSSRLVDPVFPPPRGPDTARARHLPLDESQLGQSAEAQSGFDLSFGPGQDLDHRVAHGDPALAASPTPLIHPGQTPPLDPDGSFLGSAPAHSRRDGRYGDARRGDFDQASNAAAAPPSSSPRYGRSQPPLARQTTRPPPRLTPSMSDEALQQQRRETYIATRTRREQLNAKYTFRNFVVGPSNELAHAAAIGSSGGGGPRYNPLFICGGTGLGKTHLMHSIAHQVLDLRAEACVLYVSAERFTNQFIEALQHHKMEDFRRRYRQDCDLLLLDDIQFLAGREQTQEEFFHTFNALHDMDKPIVVSSDKYPQDLQRMPERLISRFTSGLVADIQTPALETRVAIVRKKAQLEGIRIDDSVAVLLAQNVKSNVRELEGTLIRLAAKSSLLGRPIDLEFARGEMAIVSPHRPEVRSVEDIQRTVCGHFRVTSSELLSKDRHKSVAFARQVAMYLCRQRLKCSFPELGRAFGNRDHTTVMSAVRRVESLREKDPQVNAHLEAIENKLSGGEN
jgi:chromosomal replication initiator protein